MVELQTAYQLLLAIFLGALIGLEREYKGKGAGLQTYSLVALGSCFFTILSYEMISFFAGETGIVFDPIRIIQAVAVGIGFIGAGIVFHQQSGIVGLTTTTGLWVSAAIGIAVGIKLYSLASLTAFLTLLVLSGFGWLENKIFKKDR